MKKKYQRVVVPVQLKSQRSFECGNDKFVATLVIGPSLSEVDEAVGVL